MRAFSYARPGTIAEATALLEEHGPDAQIIAGGTDLVIGLRDDTIRPSLVVDLKRIAQLGPSIGVEADRLVISAGTVMSHIERHPRILGEFMPLAEAAAVVGSVQIRNRATLAGNIVNASPAADTAPPLLAYRAEVVSAGPSGTRHIPMAEFFIRSRVTALRRGELVAAVRLPLPTKRTAGAYVRLTRRRGTDLASITLCCVVDEAGITRLAYGSVGPRPLVFEDRSGLLADPDAPDAAKRPLLEEMMAAASPSANSVRASPEYRLAMLRVLGLRAVRAAIDRLAEVAA